MKNVLLLNFVLIIGACGNNEASDKLESYQPANENISPLLNPDTTSTANIQTETNTASLPVEQVEAKVGLNPEHGKPGHRCDIAVGAPLDSKPVQAANINQNSAANTQVDPATANSQQAPQKVAPGMNPSHGQPGHRCDIAVGAPLDSKPVTTPITETNVASKVVSTNQQPTPQKVAPGMNPSHGQPGHRCDIAVGAPLDSKPVANSVTTPPVIKFDTIQKQ
jgi:hypothetical protein